MSLTPFRKQIERATGYPNNRTQKKIAEILGFQESYLSQVMKGRIDDFSGRTILRVCDALGCDLKDIVDSE